MGQWGKPKKIQLLLAKKQEKALDFKEIQGFGGDKRDRTADLLNAIQALSRLDDYTPTFPQADRLYPHCILEILQPYQAAPIRLTKNCSMLILNLILS